MDDLSHVLTWPISNVNHQRVNKLKHVKTMFLVESMVFTTSFLRSVFSVSGLKKLTCKWAIPPIRVMDYPHVHMVHMRLAWHSITKYNFPSPQLTTVVAQLTVIFLETNNYYNMGLYIMKQTNF